MQEIVSKRNWDSKLFDTGRFDKERPIYGTKIQNGLHDIEPDGSFVECNPSMRDYVGHVSTLESIRGRYGSLRAGDTGSESKDRVKILTKRDCGISLKLCGHKTYGPWDDTTRKIRFDTNDGITLNYYPSYKGVNIVITIDNPQSTSNVITFSLKKYGCGYTYEEKDGNIIARSSTGKDDIFINALYAIDANGDSGRAFLRKGDIVDGYQRVEKVIEPVWFGNAVGPVESDPSVTIDDNSGTFEDANMSSVPAQTTLNWGGQPFTQLYNGVLNFSNNGLYYVDLSAYPGITITLAKYIFDCVLKSGATFTVTANPVLRQWGEGNKTGSAASIGECSGLSARTSQENWTGVICTGSGTDYNATPAATFTSPASTGIFEVVVTNASFQDKIDGTNYGDVFRVPLTNTGASVRFASSESGGNLPAVCFEYTNGDVEGIHVAFSIYDKQFNAFKELSGKNTII